eukprot:m.272479 g.272479  ORF g.272479 m.272479 type:complete len:102 (-) comp16107_c0_seq8:23-328(-)
MSTQGVDEDNTPLSGCAWVPSGHAGNGSVLRMRVRNEMAPVPLKSAVKRHRVVMSLSPISEWILISTQMLGKRPVQSQSLVSPHICCLSNLERSGLAMCCG